MVSELTLTVARTDRCEGIWCMTCVVPGGTHDIAYGAGSGRAVVP
jgi:hypothetical protein